MRLATRRRLARRSSRRDPDRTWDEDELILFADNDEPLYRQKDAFLANAYKKLAKGVYEPAAGVKLWTYYVDRAAKEYARQMGGSWNKLFPKTARLKAAEHYEKTERAALKSGEYAPKYPGLVHSRDASRRDTTQTYKASFTGRSRGAIGKFYRITTSVVASTPGEAERRLYERYEHITKLKLSKTRRRA